MHSYRPARLNNSGERIKVLVNNAKRLVCNDSTKDKTSKVDSIPAGSTKIRQSSSTTQSRGFFTNQPSRDLRRFLEEVSKYFKQICKEKSYILKVFMGYRSFRSKTAGY